MKRLPADTAGAPEIELQPSHASPIATVAMAERLHARFNLTTPISGDATARTYLAEFTRTARLLLEGPNA